MGHPVDLKVFVKYIYLTIIFLYIHPRTILEAIALGGDLVGLVSRACSVGK